MSKNKFESLKPPAYFIKYCVEYEIQQINQMQTPLYHYRNRFVT